MITFEILLFILATLFGIFIYWRESKNNTLYRTVNKITHAKEQQMKVTDKKGFIFEQAFLMRLIYIVLLVIATYLVSLVVLPFNAGNIQYFFTCIVGILAGTYFASAIVFANKKVEDGQDVIEESIEKGKEFLKDFTKENIKPTETLKEKESKPEVPKKSGRDRLKDKGLM